MSQWSYLLFGPFDYYLPFKAWEWHLKACQMWICIKSRAIYVSAGKGERGSWLTQYLVGRRFCPKYCWHSIFATQIFSTQYLSQIGMADSIFGRTYVLPQIVLTLLLTFWWLFVYSAMFILRLFTFHPRTPSPAWWRKKLKQKKSLTIKTRNPNICQFSRPWPNLQLSHSTQMTVTSTISSFTKIKEQKTFFGTIFGHWPNVRENHKHSKIAQWVW